VRERKFLKRCTKESDEPLTTYGHSTGYGQATVALVTIISRIPAYATVFQNGAVRALPFLTNTDP
jgi:hypothetical protein